MVGKNTLCNMVLLAAVVIAMVSCGHKSRVADTGEVTAASQWLAGARCCSFVNEYRIREAQRRIEDFETYAGRTLQGIAESVGIRSKSTFIVAFRSVTGMIPSAYLHLAEKNSVSES